MAGLVPQFLICKGFERETISVGTFSDQDRQLARLVSCANDRIFCHNDQRHRSLDLALRIANALDKSWFLRNQRTDQTAGIDVAAAHCLKVCTAVFQQFLRKCLCVLDYTDRANCVQSKFRTNHDRLRICIADTADADIAPHFFYILLELCPERRIFNAVNIPLKTEFRRIRCHTATSCPQVRVIVRPIKYVKNAVVC